MIKILIADDHPIVRSGLRAVFATVPDFDVIGEADSAEKALELSAALNPDVVTMDLRFGAGLGGASAIASLREKDAAPAVLVLTNYADDADILAALEAGAQGYLLKDSAPVELVSAVRQAAAGQSVLAPLVANKVVTHLQNPRPQLTGRERDVLELLAAGLSNKEIAAQLFVSGTTVKTHLARLYTKFGVPSRTAALAKARELGFIE